MKEPNIDLKEVLNVLDEPLFHPKEVDRATFIPDFQTENMTLEDVAKALKNAEGLSSQELEEMIARNFRIFLDDKYLLDYQCRQAVIDVFSNKDFLRALIKVLAGEILSEKIVTCCNKVTWDYMCQVERDKETSDLLLKLSDTANRPIVALLSAYIPPRVAQLIALARYSSFKMEKNINRANQIIVKYAEGISVQQIVNIYGIIYRYVRLSTVFSTIMLDSDRSKYTGQELERFALIGIAILEILEHGMSSPDIATILTNYHSNLEYNASPRFLLHSNSQRDYPRIYAVLDQLENNGVSIP